MTLAKRFEQLRNAPSDIYAHLPRFVSLVRELGAQHVLELGTRTGVSTVAWLYGLESTGGRLTSIDISERPDLGKHSNWRFLQGDDLDPTVLGSLEPAEIVFIDTNHQYEHTKKELAAYRPLVKPGGVIVMHDTGVSRPEGAPGDDPPHPVLKALTEFCDAFGYDSELIGECNGLGIIRIP